MRRIPRNDSEEAVLAYKALEEPFRRVLLRYSKMNAKRMMDAITAILRASGYDGKAAVLIRQAPASAIAHLEELAERLPEDERKRFHARLYGQIGRGDLTVRRAIGDILMYGPRQDADALYEAGKGALRDVAKEGMLRGEFMVQKSIGIGWQMEVPGTREVDAFLRNRWTQSDATDYLKPMSGAVRDEVEQSLFLGESPDKMARRIQKVDGISDVRAKRNARTITTAVCNDAQAEQYRRDGITQYRFVATFDERTCPVCGALDGQTFDVSERKAGSNYPPIHPNCRCTTVAVLSKASEEQIARIVNAHRNDPRAKGVEYGTTYTEWAKTHVK
jgi:SPP1 gp7 family putative phage head morphogenesis protein